MSHALRLPALLALVAVMVVVGMSTSLHAQQAVTANFGPGRDATQPGTLTFTPRGNQTEVTLNLQPGGAGVQQPAHFHAEGCPGVGPVTTPLSNVVDGRSTTMVDASLQDILAGSKGVSINVHRGPGGDANIYTACIDIRTLAAAAQATQTATAAAQATGTATAAAQPTAAAPGAALPRTGSSGLDGGAASVSGWLLLLGAGLIAAGAAGLIVRRTR